MYKVNISRFMNEIQLHYEKQEDKDTIEQLFRNLTFKLEKNLYHLNNINDFVKSSSERQDFLDFMNIYFEAESLFVSLRSTIDMNLHLINFCLDLNIPGKEVYMHSIYKARIPKSLKDIFNRYTSKYNNPLWEFIYTFRNDIVHEKSIIQKLPLEIQNIEGTNYLFTKIKRQDKELQDLFRECLKFLDRFTERTLETLTISLKNKNKTD